MFGKTSAVKNFVSFFCTMLLLISSVCAQDEKDVEETLKMYVGGTFGKAKMFGKMDKLALAQTSIYFKNHYNTGGD